MNKFRFLLALLGALLLGGATTAAITADELAQFLGVHSWTVTVDLPPGSFRADIYEVREGKVEDVWLRLGDNPSTEPGKVMTIILGPRDGHYRITVATPTGTLGTVTRVPLLPQTYAAGFAKPISEGDHILFGQTREFTESAGLNDPRGFARAFLLRIRKKDAGNAAVAKPASALPVYDVDGDLRCLSQAKTIATACKLFALDNGGRFPTTVDELEPDYLANGRGVFASPLAPTPGERGYELLGGKVTDAPDRVLVRGRFTTRDGRRSVVYVNMWGALEWR